MIGKFIGGAVGFVFGGPIGAMAGAVFGHALDSSGIVLDGRQQNPISFMEQSQLAFFVGAFSMLAKLASADGRVKQEEIETIEKVMACDFGLSAEKKAAALKIFNTALNSPARFESFAAQFYERFQHNPQMIETLFDILVRLSVSDGPLNPVEDELLLSAARAFNIPLFRYEILKTRYKAATEQAYALLGCRYLDSLENVKKRYRHLVQSFHPDKIAGKDLPEEFIQLAQARFREIQSAYEAIKRERGVN